MDWKRTIYALRHEATGKLYIGITANVHQRYLKHVNRLKNGTHNAKALQADYDTYEDKRLTMIVLEEVYDFADRDKEYEWMAAFDTFSPDRGYNYADPKLPTSPSHRGRSS